MSRVHQSLEVGEASRWPGRRRGRRAGKRSDPQVGALGDRMLKILTSGVSTRKYGQVISEMANTAGLSKSSVSREARTSERVLKTRVRRADRRSESCSSLQPRSPGRCNTHQEEAEGDAPHHQKMISKICLATNSLPGS